MQLLCLFYFLPAVLLLYAVSPKRLKNFTLLVCSLVFYAWGEPTHIFIMLITTFYIWVFGLVVAKTREQGKQGVAKIFLILTLVLSLGTLGGGNHFIEIDQEGDDLYLVIHTGSRISKGVAHPRLLRTAATLAGIS